MQTIKVVTSTNIEHFKQKARRLKRDNKITHTEALDEIARQHGFNHWHHVTQCHEHIKPAEEAFSNGCVLAFDVKDGMEVDMDDGVLIEDHLLEIVCERSLFDIYSKSPNEDDPDGKTMKETVSNQEIREYFRDDLSFIYFRIRSDLAKKSLKETLEIVRNYSFWMPQFIWLRGQISDTYHIPAEDDNGNILGLRL